MDNLYQKLNKKLDTLINQYIKDSRWGLFQSQYRITKGPFLWLLHDMAIVFTVKVTSLCKQ